MMKKLFCLSLIFAVALVAQSAQAVVINSLANDYFNDFVANLPQNNPFGPWTMYENGGTQGAPNMNAVANISPGGLGAGWDDPNSIIGYARGGGFGMGPGGGDTVNGHTGDAPGGPNPAQNKVDYAVPATSTYNLTMNIQQAFEASRSMRFDVYLNDFNGANPANLLGRVESGGVQTPPGNFTNINNVSLSAGDVLTLIIDGSGTGGNGIGTFMGFNLVVDQIPEPTSALLIGLGLSGLALSRRR